MDEDTTSDAIAGTLIGCKQEKNMGNTIQRLENENFHLKQLIAGNRDPEMHALVERISELEALNQNLKSQKENFGMRLIGENKSLEHSHEITDLHKQIEKLQNENRESRLIIKTLKDRECQNNSAQCSVYDLQLSDFIVLFEHKISLIEEAGVKNLLLQEAFKILKKCYYEFSQSLRVDDLRKNQDILREKLLQLIGFRSQNEIDAKQIQSNTVRVYDDPITLNKIDLEDAGEKSIESRRRIHESIDLIISAIRLLLVFSENKGSIEDHTPVSAQFSHLKHQLEECEREKLELVSEYREFAAKHQNCGSEFDDAQVATLQAQIEDLISENQKMNAKVQAYQSVCDHITKTYAEINKDGVNDPISILSSLVKNYELKTQRITDLNNQLAHLSQKLSGLESEKNSLEKLRKENLSHAETQRKLEDEICSLKKAQNECENLIQRVKTLERQNAALASHNDLLIKNDEEMIKLENRKLAQIVESRNQEIDECRRQLAFLDQELQKNKDNAAVLDTQNKQLIAGIQQLQDENRSNFTKIVELTQKVQDLTSQIAQFSQNKENITSDPTIYARNREQLFTLQKQKETLETEIQRLKDENHGLKNGLYKYDRNNALAIQNQNLQNKLQEAGQKLKRLEESNNIGFVSQVFKDLDLNHRLKIKDFNDHGFYDRLRKLGLELVQTDPQEVLNIYQDLVVYSAKLQSDIFDLKKQIQTLFDKQKTHPENFQDLERKYMLLCDEKENLSHHKKLAESKLKELNTTLQKVVEDHKKDVSSLEERLKAVKESYEGQLEALHSKNAKYVQQLRIGSAKYSENVQESKNLQNDLLKLRTNYNQVCDDLKLCREEFGVLCEKYRDLIQENTKLSKMCQEYERNTKNPQNKKTTQIDTHNNENQNNNLVEAEPKKYECLATGFMSELLQLLRKLYTIFENEILAAACKSLLCNELLIVFDKLKISFKGSDALLHFFEENFKIILQIFENTKPLLIYIMKNHKLLSKREYNVHIDDNASYTELKNLCVFMKTELLKQQQRYNELFMKNHKLSKREYNVHIDDNASYTELKNLCVFMKTELLKQQQRYNELFMKTSNETLKHDIQSKNVSPQNINNYDEKIKISEPQTKIESYQAAIEQKDKELVESLKHILNRLQTCVFVIKSFKVTIHGLKRLAYDQCRLYISRFEEYLSATQKIKQCAEIIESKHQAVIEIKQICEIYTSEKKVASFMNHWQKIQIIYKNTTDNECNTHQESHNKITPHLPSNKKKVTFSTDVNDQKINHLDSSSEKNTKLNFSLIKNIAIDTEVQEILIKALLTPQNIMFLSRISINSFCLNKLIEHFQQVHESQIQKIKQTEDRIKKLESSENAQRNKRLSEMITNFAQEFNIAKNELIFCQEYLQKKSKDIKKYKRQLKHAEKQLKIAALESRSQNAQKGRVSEKITK